MKSVRILITDEHGDPVKLPVSALSPLADLAAALLRRSVPDIGMADATYDSGWVFRPLEEKSSDDDL